MKYLVTEQQEEIYKIIRRKEEIDPIFHEVVKAYEPCEFENIEKYVFHLLRFVAAVVSADYDVDIQTARKLVNHLYRSFLINKHNEECTGE